MNTLRKSIVIGLTVLGMGSATFAAQAQQAAPAQPARHERGEMQAKWGERFAQHQAKLHDMLKLTQSQQQAWLNYQAAVKPGMHERGERGAHGQRGEHGNRAAWASMAAPARMEKAIEMSKTRTAMMESHLAALNTFYSTLSPEQKKVFDANTMGGEHRGGRRGHGMHGGMKAGMQH